MSVVASLPSVHHSTFVYIVTFLRELLDNNNSLSVELVARLFGNAMIRQHAQQGVNTKLQNRKTVEFMTHFSLIKNQRIRIYLT